MTALVAAGLALLLLCLTYPVVSFSHLVETNCGRTIGCFRFPPGCDFENCQHFLMWNDTGEDTVDFSISANVNLSEAGYNLWTAVGFSNDTSMPDTPVVDCIFFSDKAAIQTSYNPGYSNNILKQVHLGLVNGSLAGSIHGNLLQCNFTKYKTVLSNNSEAHLVANISAANKFHIFLPIGLVSATGVKQKHSSKIVSNETLSFADRPNINGPPRNPSLDPSDCGTTVACIRYPARCTGKQCSNMLLWKIIGQGEVVFTISARIDSQLQHGSVWTAVGFSDNQEMPDTPVVDCIYLSNETRFRVQASYNVPTGYANSVLVQSKLGLVNDSSYGSYESNTLSCTFTKYTAVNSTNKEATKVANLTKKYYVFLAVGPVNSDGMKAKHSKVPTITSTQVDFFKMVNTSGKSEDMKKVKAHGILMVLAWVIFAATGTVLARYLKEGESLLTSKYICGAQLWFRIHQILMLLTLFCTLVGVVLIFLQLQNFYTDNMLHPIIGVVVTLLVILNPVIAVFRPAKDSDKRYLFRITHGFIGLSASVLSGVNIALGVRLGEMKLPRWMFWVAVSFTVVRILVGIILTLFSKLVFNVKDESYVKLNETDSDARKGIRLLAKAVVFMYFPVVWAMGAALIIGLAQV